MSNNRGNNNRNSSKSAAADSLNQNAFVQRTQEHGKLYKNQLEAWLKSNDNFLAQYLTAAETKTGVNRVYIFLVVMGIITLYLLFGAYAGFLSHVITFVYPALGSLRALETRRQDDDTKWLTYWVVFGFLGLFEHFTEALLSVLPFYYVLKTGFQLWLCLPGVQNGSLIIYDRFLRPVANRFLHFNLGQSGSNLKGRINAQVDNAASRLNSQVDNAANYVKETTTQVRNDINNKLD